MSEPVSEPYIIFLDDTEKFAEIEAGKNNLTKLVGGKSANLMRLLHSDIDINIPSGFTITTAAFKEQCDALGLTKHTEPSEFKQKLVDSPLPQKLQNAISTAVTNLCGSKQKFSIVARSSATAEDLNTASFAGQQESYLNIKNLDALFLAIKKCWASAFELRAVKYRSDFMSSSDLIGVAVLIQQFISAEYSGVIFTNDPMGSGTMVLEIVSGVGEDLVGGEIQPIRYYIRNFQVKSGFKVILKTGNVSIKTPKDIIIEKLASESLLIEEVLGFPADIEWSQDKDGTLYILQARPITQMTNQNPEAYIHMRCSNISQIDNDRIISEEIKKIQMTDCEWSLRPFNERIVLPMIPWEQSILDFTIEPLFKTLSSFGIRTKKDREPFRLIFNRPYINVSILKDMFSDIPETVDMLLASGHTHRMQLELSISPIMVSIGTFLPIRAIRVWNNWAIDSAEFENRIKVFEKIEISKLNYTGSIQLLDRILAQLSKISTTHFQSIILGEVLFNLLVEFLIRCGFDPPNDYASVLVGGSLDNATVQTNLALFKLSKNIKDTNINDSILRSTIDYSQLKKELVSSENKLVKNNSEFLANFDAFLAKFGHRDPVHNFLFPTWKEEPLQLLSIIFAISYSTIGGHEISNKANIDKNIELRTKNEEAVIIRLQKGISKFLPVKGFLFKVLLNYTRKYMTLRENQQFLMGRAFPIIRQSLLHLGDLLTEKGVLDSKFEVFFLKHSELKEFDLKSSLTDKWLSLVYERMCKYQIFSELEPPVMVNSNLVFEISKSILSKSSSQKHDVDVIKGVGVSPGIYKGTVHIIPSPDELHEFNSGEILVCSTTNPAWTPVFPMAGAVVTDVGGMLSHGAVVAREYGLPAVLGSVNATKILHDGDLVEVDGEKGMVKILERVG